MSTGQRLAIFGIGGLGHIAVQMGRALGMEVMAVDISEEKLELAKSLGASHTFHAASTDLAKGLRRMGGAHVALVTSAAKAAYDLAFRCVRPSGTLLVVGLPAKTSAFLPYLWPLARSAYKPPPWARVRIYERSSQWPSPGRFDARLQLGPSLKPMRCWISCGMDRFPAAWCLLSPEALSARKSAPFVALADYGFNLTLVSKM